MKKHVLLSLLFASGAVFAQENLYKTIDTESQKIEQKVITWRRDFHQNPELGNEEVRTAKIIAAHLRSLGIEVQEGVAVTGVIGILKGDKPGPVVALRADMDALPVPERADLPFKSKVVTTYNGQQTGVMHACGHDSHVAILMGTAEVLSKMKKDLKGTVKFIFQPAEEGVLDTSIPFGANGMVLAGCLENPKVDAIFGLHINSQTPSGTIKYKTGPIMAAVDQFSIDIKGVQTHGAAPWSGIDPIVTGSQIVLGLQTILSRTVNVTEAPAVVSVGAIHAGLRTNIIPENLNMIGTIRTFGTAQRTLVHKRITEITTNIAESAGAKADVKISTGYPTTINHEALTLKMVPTLEKAAGKDNVKTMFAVTGAEDFSYYQEKVPGLFFFLGGMNPSKKPEEVAPHHTPDFFLDETGFTLGVKAFSYLVVDYFEQNKK